MLGPNLRERGSSKHFLLRVESCVETILQVDRCLGKGKIRADVIDKFERLKESLVNVAEDAIEEKDISRIEEATSQLLLEIRLSLEVQMSQSFHDGHIQ
jgi:hypothetical protein